MERSEETKGRIRKNKEGNKEGKTESKKGGRKEILFIQNFSAFKKNLK